MESREMVPMNLFAGQQWACRHREQTWGWGKKERVGQMERVAWKHTLMYIKQIASGNLLYDSGKSNWGSATTQTGGMVWEVGGRLKREGKYVYLWLIHVDIYGRNKHNIIIILQLKINKKKNF